MSQPSQSFLSRLPLRGRTRTCILEAIIQPLQETNKQCQDLTPHNSGETLGGKVGVSVILSLIVTGAQPLHMLCDFLPHSQVNPPRADTYPLSFGILKPPQEMTACCQAVNYGSKPRGEVW